MSVNNKHLATFLLGAAAAFGAYKYMKMTDEEKEKLANNIKDKANKLKNSALDAEKQAMDYFNELKDKGVEAMKEHLPKVEARSTSDRLPWSKQSHQGPEGSNGCESHPVPRLCCQPRSPTPQ